MPNGNVLLSDDGLEQEALELARQYPLIIYGGRGLGKTALLKSLQRALAVPDALYIDGKSGPTARNQLLDLEISAKPRLILIDNLDSLVTPQGDLGAAAVHDTIVRLGVLLPIGDDVAKSMFISTSTIDPNGVLRERLAEGLNRSERINLLYSYSEFTSRLHKLRINPWRVGWQDRWRRLIVQILEGLCETNIIDRVVKEILELTGGHPSLAGVAVQRVQEWHTEWSHFDAKHPQKEKIEREDLSQATLKVVLEDHLSRYGLPPIRSAILRLKSSQNLLEQKSYRHLVEIALSGGVTSKAPEFRVRNVLGDEGLIYREVESSGTCKFIIPGTLICRELVESPVEGISNIEAMPDESSPRDRGELIVRSDGQIIKRLGMIGTPWKVLVVLLAERGKFLTKEELGQRAGLDSARAAQNAVQRLRNELKAGNVEGIIKSEYSRGYSISSE